MALSGNFNTNKYSTQSSGTIGLNLSWEATQSIADNQTIISWTLKSNGTMSSGYSVWGGPITVVIGGTTVFSQTSRIRVYGSGSFKRTGTVTITHDEDGTKTISMSVRAALYSSSVNCTGSSNYTLDTINRYALLNTVENFTDESYPTITYLNPAGTSLTTGLKVRITWNNGANYTAWHNLADDGTDSPYTFDSTTLTAQNIADMLAACPNSNSLTVKFDLQSTMDGTDYHSYKEAVMNVVNANPIAGAITYADVDAATVAKTGDDQLIVQGFSTLRVHVAAATAKKSATISSYNLNFNGTDYTPDNSGNVDFVNPNIAGTYAATVTVTDSRGNKTTTSIDIVILECAWPTAIYLLQRVSNFYTETILNVDGKISSIGGTNVLTITEKHRKKGESAWSAPSTVQDATDTTLQLDNLYEWEVQVTVADSYNSTTATLTVGKGIPLMFWDTKRSSVGVNGFPDNDDQLYVGGDIKATGGMALGTPLPVSSGGVGADNAATARTNLGLGCTELFTGSMSSGSETFNNAGYTMLLVMARVTTSGSHNTMMVPMMFLSSSNSQFCISDDTDFITYSLKVENGVITLTWGSTSSGSGYIEKVYGII